MTDLTIGALTALHRICESIDSISSTASSHSRAFVIEVMGRHCGWLALLAGIATGADFIFIPESPPEREDWEGEMCDLLKSHRAVGKRKSIVIVAEGALDRNLKPIKPDYVKDILVDRLGLDTRVTTLGHTQRGGKPCAYDRILVSLTFIVGVCRRHGRAHCAHKIAHTSGSGSCRGPLVCYSRDSFVHDRYPRKQDHQSAPPGGCCPGTSRCQLDSGVLLNQGQTQAVAEAIEAKDFVKAMSFRDSEFQESLQAFKISSSLATRDHVAEDKVSNFMMVKARIRADDPATTNRYYSVSHLVPV